jgi:hypothetical protein
MTQSLRFMTSSVFLVFLCFSCNVTGKKDNSDKSGNGTQGRYRMRISVQNDQLSTKVGTCVPIQLEAIDSANTPSALSSDVFVTLKALTDEFSGKSSTIAAIYGTDSCADKVELITVPAKGKAPAFGTAFVKSTAAGGATVQASYGDSDWGEAVFADLKFTDSPQ